MTNEEWDEKVEFILNQQAQFSADIGQLKESMARLENIVAQFVTATVNRFEALEARTDERFTDVDAKIAALVDAQIRTEEAVRETAENVKNLAAIVNRYFAGRNGETKADD